MLGCRKLAGHTDTKFGRNETKKGSVAISRSRILGKWDHRGFVDSPSVLYCGFIQGLSTRNPRTKYTNERVSGRAEDVQVSAGRCLPCPYICIYSIPSLVTLGDTYGTYMYSAPYRYRLAWELQFCVGYINQLAT